MPLYADMWGGRLDARPEGNDVAIASVDPRALWCGRVESKVAVVHIGTHKTGSTSFQAMLARNNGLGSEAGLYYPETGRSGDDGHHALAAELIDGDQTDPRCGLLGQLAQELKSAGARSVILSSENFSHLYRRPDRLQHLRDALQAGGMRTEIVIVLRPPSDYLESLYVELLKHGLTEPIDVFVQQGLSTGAVTLGGRDFCLDYRAVVTGFAAVFTRTIRARAALRRYGLRRASHGSLRSIARYRDVRRRQLGAVQSPG